jgi:hypothetical protein
VKFLISDVGVNRWNIYIVVFLYPPCMYVSRRMLVLRHWFPNKPVCIEYMDAT